MAKWKVAFATGSRADYGIMRRYLALMRDCDDIELTILVTGALLSDEYGHQVDLVREDGFDVGAEVELPLDSTTNRGVISSMGVALDGFADLFATNPPDLLIILGDRYEVLSVAIAAAMQRVPILHIHGGEATYANYDEFVRHAITKMSLYHFTATEQYRRRVIQLGEHPDRVFYLGALGSENCLVFDESKACDEVKDLKGTEYLVILFHPETISNANVENQMGELLGALSEFNETTLVFLGSNADTHSDRIRGAVHKFVEKHANARYYENLRTNDYHCLVHNAVALVGNSSSGLIEAPSLGAKTVNIGNRQDGRVRGASVFDTPCEKHAIIEAIKTAGGAPAVPPEENPYYKPNTARSYFETTCELLSRLGRDTAKPKEFFDLDCCLDL